MNGCYYGIFDCYSPGRGSIPHLVMSGVFDAGDLHRVSIMIDNHKTRCERVSYYGWRHG